MPRRTKPASVLAGSKRVTDLVHDRRVPGNLVVEINGARFASLPADIVSALGVELNLELDDDRFERLTRVADVEAAYSVALRMLAARPRAVNELLTRLRDRGHNPSAVAEAVGRLESKGLLDDTEFARHFARTRLARGHGSPRILTDLLSRGVERRVAERAIDEVVELEEVDENEEARALALKRARQLGDLPAPTLRRRLLAYLARRGHRGWEVTDVVEGVVGEVTAGKLDQSSEV